MITIIIDNSYSRIVGLTVAQDKELRNLLSYKVGSFHSGFGQRKVSLLSKKAEYPSGLNERVVGHLLDSGLDFEIKDLRVRPTKGAYLEPAFSFSTRISQIKAVRAAIANHTGSIIKPTGSGKSAIISLLIAYYNVPTLIVVTSLALKEQLTLDLLDVFKGKSRAIVENIQSPRLKTMKNFNMLIIDEADMSAAKTYRKLNKTTWNGIYHRFFLTATPFRSDPEEDILLESIVGQPIYTQTYQEAVEAGEICPIEAYAIDIPKQNIDAYSWAQVYSELVVKNDIRNEIIAITLLRLVASNVSTLCLVKEVAHGKRLAELTGLPFIHGEDAESKAYIRQFSDKQIVAVIATEGVMGRGVDTKACEYILIAGLGKAKSAFMQKCGRAVRRYGDKISAKIVLFRDASHKFTLRHYNIQRKILKDEYHVTPIKLEIKPTRWERIK